MDRCPISRGLQLLNWDINQHLMLAKYQQSTSLKAQEVAGIMEIGSNTLTVHGQPVQAVLQACRQESLAKDLLHGNDFTYNAHNEIGDVNTNMPRKELLADSFLLQASYNFVFFNQEKKKKVGILDIMVAKGVF